MSGLDKCLTEKNGVFTSEARLQETEPLLESIVAIQGVDTLQFYSVDASDLGSGLLLANGRFANPINDPQVADNALAISDNATAITTKQNKGFDPIAIPTALQVGGKYCSTLTNTHTLADGVNAGTDSVVFSWLAGTIGTITGASAIVFTDKDNVLNSDVTWVFDFPIVTVNLIWNGSNWEIQ